jgi:hypothetical protein
MGGSSWSDDYYADRAATRATTGTPTFAHDAAVRAAAARGDTASVKTHAKLNPFGVIRESRDSDAHPDSVAIGVILDHTGSMGSIPRTLQAKLPQLMSLLLRKGYVKDPQILMGSVGDTCDGVQADQGSFQAGQFESGVEMDEDISNLWLRGGGGGGRSESYQNAMYFFARKTSIDCFEKRGQRGYLFIIGDELAYNQVSSREAKALFGDNLQSDIPTEEIVAELKERYNVFFVIPRDASYGSDRTLRAYWEKLLGSENVLGLDDPDAVCECIALAIGLCEGNVDLNDGKSHLTDGGSSASIVRSVTNALGDLSKKTALARAGTGDLPARTGKAKGVKRL